MRLKKEKAEAQNINTANKVGIQEQVERKERKKLTFVQIFPCQGFIV